LIDEFQQRARAGTFAALYALSNMNLRIEYPCAIIVPE
jgi:hypothetical protein